MLFPIKGNHKFVLLIYFFWLMTKIRDDNVNLTVSFLFFITFVKHHNSVLKEGFTIRSDYFANSKHFRDMSEIIKICGQICKNVY